ncbi:hypothetical protein PV797_05695 [Clostridiaceae bacterium M8S5]|nr:hypothetical protein PV797_05695 [Clostridiaceae bacterium M8S5]
MAERNDSKSKPYMHPEFIDIKELRTEIGDDNNSAIISWTHDIVKDEKDCNGNVFRFEFCLVKNDDNIWKVEFLPMQ